MAKFNGQNDVILAMAFQSCNENLVICSKNDVFFAMKGVKGVTLKKSTGWNCGDKEIVERQPVLCVANLVNDIVVGTSDGQILEFKGSNIYKALPAHKGPVNSMAPSKSTGVVISGGADGFIKYWDENLECLKTIDIRSMAKIPRIRAICESKDGKKLVVGTRIGNILVIEGEKKKLVHQCHSDNEVWGLHPIPKSPDMVTCGGDSMVAYWNIKGKTIRRSIFLKEVGMCLAVSPDAKTLAVGCVTGHLFFINMSDFKVIANPRDRYKEISVVKFSPCGNFLAAGGSDTLILIYDSKTESRIRTLKGHKSALIALDWSIDSKYIHSNGFLVEDMYWINDETGSKVADGSVALKNVEWSDWTCIYGWASQGIWSDSTYGTEVNAASRSHDKSLLAVGDDYGRLKVFKYPCYSKKASHFTIIGHASKIGDVYFNTSSDHLFSLGYIDNTMMQWKISVQKSEVAKKVELNGFVDDDLIVSKRKIFSQSKQVANQLKLSSLNIKKNIELISKDIEDAHETLSELPFRPIAEATIPEEEKKNIMNKEPPEGNLYLSYCFGYRAYDCKSNLKFLPNSKSVVYSTAALAVVMNTIDKSQTFFNTHTDDLVALDVTKDRQYCATGSICNSESATDTDFLIWETQTLKEVGRVTDFHSGSVSKIRFSPDINVIASIGKSASYKLAIHDWKDNRLVCSADINSDSVYDMDWLDKVHLVTVGKTHIKFWSIKMKSLICYSGQWGEHEAEPLISARYGKELCFTGSSNGNIGIWSKCILVNVVKDAHKMIVNCLHYDEAQDKLYSGGKDGVVKVWRIAGTLIVELEIIVKPDQESWDFRNSIRALDVHSDGSVLVGFRNSKIVKISNGTKSLIMSGHHQGSINSVAVHPTKSQFITAGDDRTVRLWDVIEKKMIKEKFFKKSVTALDWSDDGQIIIAALQNGSIVVLNDSLEKLTTFKSHFSEKPELKIAVVKLCPKLTKDGNRTLAIGAKGNVKGQIDIVKIDVKPEIERVTVLNLNAAGGVTHMNWSEDGDILALNTERGELKFIQIKGGYEVPTEDAKMATWHAWTCIYGFPTLGTFPNIVGADVSSVCRSHHRKMIATGDIFQDIKLFRYPSIFPKSGCKYYFGHASTITDLKFMMNDNCLISVGGEDNTIVVWATDFGEAHPDRDLWLKTKGITYDP